MGVLVAHGTSFNHFMMPLNSSMGIFIAITMTLNLGPIDICCSARFKVEFILEIPS